MTFHMLWVITLGLSMDAFAVSISKGLAMRAFRWKQALAIACCFGLFQGIMPAIGYVIGIQKQSRDFWRFSVISHGCENPTRTWCFLSANFRLLDYNLTNFVFFKRVIIEC